MPRAHGLTRCRCPQPARVRAASGGVPKRASVISEGIYHEQQEGMMCAKHAINNLLQKREGGELFKEKFAFLPPWTYILIVCTLFGPLVGLLIRVCGEPMANLPVTIFRFAMSPFTEWQQLAWAGVFLITVGVLALNIVARMLFKK